MIKISMFILLSVALASGELCAMIQKEMAIVEIALPAPVNQKDVARADALFEIVLSDVRKARADTREIALKALKCMMEKYPLSYEKKQSIIGIARAKATRPRDEYEQQMAYELFAKLFEINEGFRDAEEVAELIIHRSCAYALPDKMRAFGFKLLAKLILYNHSIDVARVAIKYGMTQSDENMQQGATFLKYVLNEQLQKMLAKL